MRLIDRITMLLNDIIATENKTLYQEGKQDGLNIALREIESFPSVYLVRVYGDAEREDENDSMLVFANNKEQAIDSAKKAAQSLPYANKKSTTYEAEEISPEFRIDNRVFWM